MAKKARTNDLPGMVGPGVEDKRIKALDDAIDEYEDAKEKRITLTERETVTRIAVQDYMRKHAIRKYRCDGKLYEMDDKLRVSKLKDAKDT